jgi:DNA-binding NarL/FixJ family response regulator
MSIADRIKVLIAHRNPLVSAGLEAAFAVERDFDVACADAGRVQALGEAGLDRAKVVIADCETGLALIAPGLRRGCRVLIVTDDVSEASIRRAVELGAGGYLLLSSSLEAVLSGVRCVSGGGTALDPVVTTKMIASLAGDSLTPREVEVLRLMMEGLSDKAIANSLDRSVGTAKAHVKAILAKLDAGSRTEAVAIARRRGLVPEAMSSHRALRMVSYDLRSNGAVRADAENV